MKWSRNEARPGTAAWASPPHPQQCRWLAFIIPGQQGFGHPRTPRSPPTLRPGGLRVPGREPRGPPMGAVAAVLGRPLLAPLLAAEAAAAPHVIHIHLLPAGPPHTPGRAGAELWRAAHPTERRDLCVPRRPLDHGGAASTLAVAAALARQPSLEAPGAADQEPGAAGGEQLPEVAARTAHGHADRDHRAPAPAGEEGGRGRRPRGRGARLAEKDAQARGRERACDPAACSRVPVTQ